MWAQAQAERPVVSEAELRELYAKAHDAFTQRDYESALRALRRVQTLTPSPLVLCNIGQVESARRDYKAALADYDECLSKVGDSLDQDSRRRIEVDRARLRTPSKISVEASVANAEVLVDDGLLGSTPLAAHTLAAGEHTLTVRKPYYAQHRQQFTVEPGENRPIRVELTPLSPPLRSRPPVWPWVVSGVAAVGGTVTGVAALVASQSQSSKLTTYPMTHDELTRGADRVKLWSTVSDGLLATAAIAGCVGLVLTLYPPRTSTHESSAQRPRLSIGLGALRLDANLSF